MYKRQVAEDRDQVHYVVRPLEAYFRKPEVVEALVEAQVRKRLKTVNVSAQKFPPVVANWFKRALGDIVPGLEAWGFEDLINEGWVRLEPDLKGSSKSQWRGAIILQNPNDPTQPPFTLDDHWEPKLSDYEAIQDEKFKNP